MFFTITRQFIMDNRTERRAWTRKQLDIIGIAWPPINGWIERVIGQQITYSEAGAFIAAAEDFAKSTERARPTSHQNTSKNSSLGLKHEYLGFDRCFDMNHEEAVDAQAVLLLRERMEIFEDDWERNCAIRIPYAVRKAIGQIGWRNWLKADDSTFRCQVCGEKFNRSLMKHWQHVEMCLGCHGLAKETNGKMAREQRQTKAFAAVTSEANELYRALPDPFCRYCKKRKPCGC